MLDFSPAALAEMLIRLPVLLLALTMHECAHAWTADRLGDPTARYLGRVTLNPLRHLDPLGTICLLFAPIGWAKPVPVNPLNFRRPGRDDILVSIAGPASNLLQAILFVLLLRLPWLEWILRNGGLPNDLFNSTGQRHGSWLVQWAMQAHGLQQVLLVLWIMISTGVLINVGLAVFNMLPFAPLDGHHVARENLRGELRDTFIRLQPMGPFFILALIVIDRMMSQSGHLGPITWPIAHLTELLVRFFGGHHAQLAL